MPSQAEHTAWLASLSPWPKEFGLGRMRTLLAALGDPQLAYPAIHVVGTNGKSTATRTIEALLLAEGLSVGATVSPHVRSWAERITRRRRGGRLRGGDRARPARGGGAGGDAVRDALRGRVRGVRRSATSTSRSSRRGSAGASTRRTCSARTSSCSRTSGSSTPTCSARRARRSRPRSSPSSRRGRSPCCPTGSSRASPARTSSSAAPVRRRRRSSGRSIEHEVEVTLPGRLERRGDEVWDGAHNADGVRWLAARLDRDDYTARRLDPPRQGRATRCSPTLARTGRRFVATQSSNARVAPGRRARAPRRAPLRRGRDRARSRRCARPWARARARPRHRLAVPSCGFGEERGVI